MEKADYVQMMKGYAEVSKTYVQLAVGSLVLPLTFIRDVLGVKSGEALKPFINGYLWCGWLMLLTCIATGLIYQVVAARRIAEFTGGAPHTKNYPRLFFNASVVSFMLGIVLFVAGVALAPVASTKP
jgi:hypothetical protein